ncbi:MAG: hypothetical protein NDJ89_14990 [Oligoflexia bacterium]|nr:hypothetical protein [Oligoflexia bacterium]
MNPEPGVSSKLILSILFFPVFFQETFLTFAWGAEDPVWLMALKRLLLLLPVCAILLACWATIVSLVSVVIRHERTVFLTALVITWWDLGRSILAFWGGIFKFVFLLIQAVLGFLRLLVLGLWVFVLDLLLLPFRLIRSLGENVLNPRIPWIAVLMMIFWCLFEATLFTYVTSPLVVDTLSNLIGDQISERLVRFPLFLFMLFIILGSYAVLSNLTEAVATRRFAAIFKIGVIELVAMFVEVVFLYREFVDALVPWFAQHSSDGFKLGLVGTLAIAGTTWLGIRALSWYLFASHGTPILMAVIQGTGLRSLESGDLGIPPLPGQHPLAFSINTLQQAKKEIAWVQDRGEMLLAAFILPPLQIIATGVNFCVLALTSKHLFPIPLKTLGEVMDRRPELRAAAAPAARKAPPAPPIQGGLAE